MFENLYLKKNISYFEVEKDLPTLFALSYFRISQLNLIYLNVSVVLLTSVDIKMIQK